jgi:hypothetical protein
VLRVTAAPPTVATNDLYGDGGLITTINDLAKWSAAFYEDRIGEPGVVRLMTTRGRLNSGEEINYAMGLEYDNHRGYKTIRHGGGILGYVAEGVHFPDLKLSVVVCGNTNEAWVTGLAYDVADVFLPPPQGTKVRARRKIAATPLETPRDQFCGHYWNATGNFFRRVTLISDYLYLDAGEGTRRLKLEHVGQNNFNLIDDSYVIAQVSFRADPDGAISRGSMIQPLRSHWLICCL